MMCANVARVAVVGCFGNDGVTKHQACSVGMICYEGAFLICGWLDPWVCTGVYGGLTLQVNWVRRSLL